MEHVAKGIGVEREEALLAAFAHGGTAIPRIHLKYRRACQGREWDRDRHGVLLEWYTAAPRSRRGWGFLGIRSQEDEPSALFANQMLWMALNFGNVFEEGIPNGGDDGRCLTPTPHAAPLGWPREVGAGS